MQSGCRRNDKAKGFTLLELMIVLSILAITAAVTVPFILKVTEKARRTEAYTLMLSLRVGLLAYKDTYHVWPPAIQSYTNSQGDIEINVQPGAWGEVYRSLCGYQNTKRGYRAINHTVNNWQNLILFDVPLNSFSAQLTAPYQPGVEKVTDISVMIDPWRRPYHLLLEQNGDNILNVPAPSGGVMPLPSPIAIWSTGSTPDDLRSYVTSWQ